ncbi:MAG TPA: DegT/DnrJ/EryC1/StrS family aminotransferase [Planctomycetota bacterium]|nr:DegT/DnrJ/EryC1/StrS family aminotransferase [Planctomycetota bacterium]
MSPVQTIDSVPLLDLKRQNEACAEELRAAFERVLASGHFILGPEVEAFERECAALLGAKHAIGVSSGTDALLLAFMALGIGPGDEVVCPSYTFFATAGCIARLGAKPVFVDVKSCCFNMDPALLERAITPRTKAIVPVHLFGQVCDMGAILAIAQAKKIAVVEDAAQSLSARYKGRAAGTLAEFGCFSFFPSKNLGAFGDAGLVTTQDDALAEKARILRVHGSKPKYFHQLVGGNFRIDALQAALLRVKLPRLEGYTRARRANAERYRKAFSDRGLAGRALELPQTCEPDPIWNQFVLRIPGAGKRDALMAHLKERKVGTEVYYPLPLHSQKCFAHLGYKEGSLPVSERAAKETLALPVFPELLPEEIDYVVDAVAGFFGKASR